MRGAGLSHRDQVFESVSTDLNNPPFSRSPGCFHARLLTAGTRSCCPFSTDTPAAPATVSTPTETQTLHTMCTLSALAYDKKTSTIRQRWRPECLSTYSQAHRDAQEASYLLILPSPSWGTESWTTGVLSSCLSSAAVYMCTTLFRSTLPRSQPHFNKQFGIQTYTACPCHSFSSVSNTTVPLPPAQAHTAQFTLWKSVHAVMLN